MKSIGEASGLEIVLQCLGNVWEPATEAFRVQNELGVDSLDETPAAVERAGYEICLVDLPDKVNGFAEIIADKPYIVLNRQKSPQNLRYTMPHELGHHILHLNPLRKPRQLGLSGTGSVEIEADLFATTWLLLLGKDRRRDDVLLRNPEASKTLAIYLLLTVAIVLFTLFASFMLRNVPETR